MKFKENPLKNIDSIISTIFLIMIFIDVMLQIISRITPGNAIFWTVEVGEMLLAAVIWMTIGPAVLSNSHVRFDLILIRLPRKTQKYLFIIGNIVFAVFLIILAVLLSELMIFYKNHNSVTTGLGWNKFYVRIPMFVGCIVGAIRLTIQSWQFAKDKIPIPIDAALMASPKKGGK